MSGFVVDVSAVRCAAARTTATRDDLDAVLARLRRDVDDVVSSRWRGEAATAFTTAWQRWDRAAGAALAELGRLGDELSGAASDYRLRDVTAAADLGAVS